MGSLETNQKRTVGLNIGKRPLRIFHQNLKRISDESAFKVYCPACPDGILLVFRDQDSLRVLSHDRCLSCGQHVVYLDKVIGDELVVAPGMKTSSV